MSKILLAEPWIGEFGWELFCWQGYLRKLSKNYDKTIIISRSGREFLYKDFADEYIVFDTPKNAWCDSWMCKAVSPETINKLTSSIKHTHKYSVRNNGYMSFKNKQQLLKNGFYNQEYFKYKSDSLDKTYDILVHPRNKEVGAIRNWNKENWNELVKLLSKNYKIGVIGSSEAFKLDNASDHRNISIEDTVSLMNRSKLVVGQSSGPLHLASLSGAPHFVWSDNSNYNRYTSHWNPFKTKVYFYDKEGWNPKVNNIYNEIIKSLK